MNEVYLYSIIAFVVGFLLAWVLRSLKVSQMAKNEKDARSLLDNEKMIKETQRKESLAIQRHQQGIEIELRKKLDESRNQLRQMDENLILLQRSNEETEQLLKANQPELHALKIKLLEAQNTIARYKAKLENK